MSRNKIHTIDPGALDRKVTIRTYSTTTNELGQKVEGAASDIWTYASVMEADPSKEVNLTDQITYKAILKVVVRYRSMFRDLKAKLVYEGNEYDVRAVRSMPGAGRNRYMTITAVQYD